MGCCIAVAMVIAVVRRIWFAAVPGRAAAPVTFAPAAFRPAPGAAPAAPAPARITSPGVPGSRLSAALGAAAVTVAAYAGLVAVLLWTGVAHTAVAGRHAEHTAGGPAVGWTTRDLLLTGLGVGLIAGAAALHRGPLPRWPAFGATLVGAGLSWFALGILDMHVFRLVHVGSGSFSSDLLVHGPGIAAYLVGLVLLNRAATDVIVRPVGAALPAGVR